MFRIRVYFLELATELVASLPRVDVVVDIG